MPVRDRLSPGQQWRRAGNVVNLSTPLGLGLALAGRARLRPGPGGLTFAEGFRFGFPRAGAFTVGNVVLTATTMDDLAAAHPGVWEHEDAHAWQYFWCLGLPFLPLYLLAAAWSWVATGDVASANVFERHAGLVKGGYPAAPTRTRRRPGPKA